MDPRAAATAAALVGACALLLPGRTAPPAAEHRIVVVAHRGASGYAPENTLQAVDKAADLGVTWVENDVQRTRDGRLVVIHDSVLTRTTDVERVYPGRAPWRVADFTAAEIARLDAGSWKGARYAGVRVPTLEEYLRRVEHHGQSLLLEVKEPERYPGIENDVLKTLGREHWLDRDHVRHRLIIQSFNADSVRTVHALRPDVRTGFLGNPPIAELPRYAAFADQVNPDRTRVSADYVKAVHGLNGAHGARLETYVWTVDDAAAARRTAGYGADGIITNHPDTVKDALGDRATLHGPDPGRP